MTVRMLRAAGLRWRSWFPEAGGRPDAWRVRPGPLSLGSVTVEPDLSNAGRSWPRRWSPGGTITIPDWPRDSLQAAGEILDVLSQMGARYSVGRTGLTISGTGRIHGVTRRSAGRGRARAGADRRGGGGPSPRRSSPAWRTPCAHETDRLAALAKEINALGGESPSCPTGLQIRPRPLRAEAAGGPFGTYDDHRMVIGGGRPRPGRAGPAGGRRGHGGQDLPGLHGSLGLDARSGPLSSS